MGAEVVEYPSIAVCWKYGDGAVPSGTVPRDIFVGKDITGNTSLSMVEVVRGRKGSKSSIDAVVFACPGVVTERATGGGRDCGVGGGVACFEL